MTSPNTPPPGQPDPAALLALGLATQATDAGASSTPPLTPAELASEFPQLEILELLGRGGMGAVYKARQRDLDRLVALKILRPGLDADPGFAERFTREARALAQLNHPGIVTLYEFGKTSAGRYFILMEFVDGMNLRQLLAAGRLSPREALAIVPPLCDALQYAHDRGLIHRDIKPENILIDRLGRVKIADFGIARLASEGRDVSPRRPSENITLTSLDETMGTPAYMAPEQHTHPASIDHRADLYALGVVFYQMLTGELPAAGQLQPPSQRVQLDVRLDEIVLRALEKDPARRYAAASEIKTEVETVTAAIAPPAASRDERPRQRLIHFPWVILLPVTLILAILIAVFTHSASSSKVPETHLSTASSSPKADADNQAINQAYAWLRTVDQQDYAKSWTTASESLRKTVTQENWIAALTKARGEWATQAIGRSLENTKLSPILPHTSREGHYCILQFGTILTDRENKSDLFIETLTLIQESSGDWRVAGYLIRPRSSLEREAVVRAHAWLDQIDDGQFGPSWDHASDAFRRAITRDQWIASLNGIRPSLGKVKIRLINTTQTTTNLPGAPDGRYIVMTFNTAFENKRNAVETVTFEELKDGALRASGYFIR